MTTCRSSSKYGKCGREAGHGGDHAVPIGDDVWFGYKPGSVPIGFGRLLGDAVMPFSRPRRTKAGGLPAPARDRGLR